jgi:2-methylcitrate dehydratase
MQKAAKVIIDKSDLLRSAADRHHCIVAVVRSKGDVIDTADDMGDLDDSPWATDPGVDLLRGTMSGVEDEAFTRDYHDLKMRSGPNGITIELASGEVFGRGGGGEVSNWSRR